MSDNDADQNEDYPRKRVRQACLNCRKKKVRCSGEKPVCDLCGRLAQTCRYVELPDPSAYAPPHSPSATGLAGLYVAVGFPSHCGGAQLIRTSRTTSMPSFRPSRTDWLQSNRQSKGKLRPHMGCLVRCGDLICLQDFTRTIFFDS